MPLSLEPPYSQLRKIGRAVAARRRELKISQEDFAETCDLHRTHMGEIERGEVNLSWQSLARVARGLKLKPSALLLRAGL
ncbi:MAG TPA: helix-turn-helix transcriptional regulator [Opitutaceae bacterium]